MGLIKSIVNSASGVLSDQWREYFYQDAIDSDVLVTRAKKRTSSKSSNNGNDNIISNGSIIAIADGQCMIIVDNGKISEISAEAGTFTYDSSTEPSLFYGDLGENIKNTFLNIGKRFTFGSDVSSDQRVYFFNMKEILGNKYGTKAPVPFRVVDNNIGLDIDISIRCHGEFSYKIIDPLLFYTNVCGNIKEDYKRENLDSILREEVMTALQPAFAKISAMGIRYSALMGHTEEISAALNEILSEKWLKLRGIKMYSFTVPSVKASEEDENMIKELQRNAVFRNPTMAAAHLTSAQADALRNAAQNENGAMMGFMGMNMASNAGGMNANSLFQMGANQAQNQAQNQTNMQNQESIQKEEKSNALGWNCSCGRTSNSGKFCVECGNKRVEPQCGWNCSCGAKNEGKFCPECGGKKPADAPLYACDKCGFRPEDPKNPPKFCPECGDSFDENDIV